MSVEELLAQTDFKTLLDIYLGIMKATDLPPDRMWQLRHWDGMDGTWTDVGPAQTPHEALKSWFRKTEGGEKNTKFDDTDYYRVFDAGTKMKWGDGAEMFREGTPAPEPDPLIVVENKKRRPPWRFDLAAQLLSCLERHMAPVGWHVGITGSVFHAGESAHDLDMILYPRDSTKADKDAARKVLESIGMKQRYTVEQVHEGWRSKGSTDEKHVEVWKWHHYRIDVFFLR